MSGWLNNLKNLQGHITEFASEVLNEAAEEVADPESELQVTKRRCTELEEQLKEAEAKREAAENQRAEAEEKLVSTHYEMDAIGSRYGSLVAARDDEIKKLRVELEQTRASLNEDDVMDDEMREERIDNLKKEVAHWKALVVQGGPDASGEQIRRQKDQEIAALIQMHEEKVEELKEHYEEKLAMHVTSGAASSSESSEAMLDAVMLEKEELMEEKRKLEEELARRKHSSERAVMVDVGERDEGTTAGRMRESEDEVERLRREIEAFAVKETELEQLKLVNKELTAAYNDLNGELETLKQREGRAANNNRDLMIRIDALKADVIEYEERYEVCKRENAETLRQLEKLTADFDRLRKGIDEAKYTAEKSDTQISGEVEKLRAALEQSKEDRDGLRGDVDRFKNLIESIDSELQLLRDSNSRLTEENVTISGQLDTMGGSMKGVLERSERDLREFRIEFTELQKMMKDKEREFAEREANLLEQIAELERYKGVLEESLALKEKICDALTESSEAGEKKEEAEAEAGERSRDTSSPARLGEQLREALCANTEITEENERMREEREELEKEIQMRQSCIDEMIQQSSILQAAQQNAALNMNALRKEIADRDKLLREAEVRSVHDKEEIELHKEELELLKTKISESVVRVAAEKGAELDEERAEREKREEEREREMVEMRRRVEEAEKRLKEREEEVERERMERAAAPVPSALVDTDRLSSLEEEIQQVKQIATQKHEESLAYYGQLQSSTAEIHRLQSLLDGSTAQLDALRTEGERREKAERELGRLKEHLVMVEETSVVEAREAEQRETRLIERVRTLEASQSATLSTAEESTSSSQARISSLELSLRAAEADARGCRERAERAEREREEAAAALSSLQGVVRDLATEHDSDSAHSAQQAQQLRLQLTKAKELVRELQEEVEKVSMDKQAAEDGMAMARERTEAKQRAIDELEVRLEEAHSAATTKATASASQYRIDDGTLRQLFLSYFLSPVDRRADIALLLASILEYPANEMEKVKGAINASIGKGSNSMGGGGGGSSITEQFIRFLETESESSRTAPHLAVKRERSAMAADASPAPSQGVESSSSLLRDILSPPPPVSLPSPPAPVVPSAQATVPSTTDS